MATKDDQGFEITLELRWGWVQVHLPFNFEDGPGSVEVRSQLQQMWLHSDGRQDWKSVPTEE